MARKIRNRRNNRTAPGKAPKPVAGRVGTHTYGGTFVSPRRNNRTAPGKAPKPVAGKVGTRPVRSSATRSSRAVVTVNKTRGPKGQSRSVTVGNSKAGVSYGKKYASIFYSKVAKQGRPASEVGATVSKTRKGYKVSAGKEGNRQHSVNINRTPAANLGLKVGKKIRKRIIKRKR